MSDSDIDCLLEINSNTNNNNHLVLLHQNDDINGVHVSRRRLSVDESTLKQLNREYIKDFKLDDAILCIFEEVCYLIYYNV